MEMTFFPLIECPTASQTQPVTQHQGRQQQNVSNHLPHVHRVVQRGHLVIRQEVIDGHEVALELLLKRIHSEVV